MTTSGDDRAPAVARALRVLSLLEAAGGETLGVSEMARQLGVARSSLFNVCLALEAEGVIQRVEGGYRLGRRLVELGGAYLRTVDPVQAFYQACSDTPFLHDEICQLAVLDGTDVLYLAAHAGRLPLRMTASIGSRFPASITAVGNALLASLDDEELERRFENPATRPAWTADSVTDLEALINKIRDVRKRGHARDVGEVFTGIRGLAVTVAPQYSGEQAYAVGTSLLEVYCTPHIEQQAIEALSDMATHIANPMNLGRGTAGAGT
ncbi:ArsR family transcriptional regulator [Kushneria pakistanensis]|uniref:HTH-type transcriptional repressor AllR n=1 Tax=Kushneria pakistanensis TaxID=1508770 RepID=A0ABQ3FPU1_9GAMM|nr:IclR family transcriptional regulator [Kushneria pakistanensis]GHC33152.1 ArsR family transcriptional regulator [Kushneria pakistanensis]